MTSLPTTPRFQPAFSASAPEYVVLESHEAQLRADKRCDELLMEQWKRIGDTYLTRIGGLLESWTPANRKQWYAIHEPMIVLPGFTVDDWLNAYDHQDARAEFYVQYGQMLPQILMRNPPSGAPVTDPQTGQVIQPSSPTYALRSDMYNRLVQQVTGGQPSLGAVLGDWIRAIYVYAPQRGVKLLRDYRRLTSGG